MNVLSIGFTMMSLVCLWPLSAQSVDFGTLKKDIKDKLKAKPFEINGGASLNAIYTEGSQKNPQPFTYVASANVVCKIYGYELPFSFTYSNKQFSTTNPNFRFNRTSFNPKYKAWTGHFGDIATSFSPYTLSGIPFQGAGIEYAPEKWKVEVVAGRIYKPVAEVVEQATKPTFYRFGMGIKTGYENKGKRLGLAVFYAKDDPNSIPLPRKSDNAEVRPMENIAFATTLALPVGKKITWQSEVSTSVLTRDLMQTQGIFQSSRVTEQVTGRLLPQRNGSTKVYYAVKTSLNYTIEKTGQIGLSYERVDPRYQTLGGLFFTNDFENLTLNAQHKGLMNISFSTGLQRDDIADRKRNSTGRMVVSANMGGKIGEKVDMSLNYSNFQSYAFIQTGFERINRLSPLDNLDTLHFTQLAQNAAFNLNYALQQSEKTNQTVAFNMNFMESAMERNQTTQQDQTTQVTSGGLAYNLNLVEKNITLAVAMNYAVNLSGTKKIVTTGPTISAAKPLFDKLITANANLSYNQSRSPDGQAQVITAGIGANTVLKKKHNLTLNWVVQQSKTPNAPQNFNTTINAGYNYTF